jgi:hypothetical protein
MSAPPATRRPVPINGNTPWAVGYAAELREIITDYARRSPRNLQVHLGPSELGVACDRQVVGKLAGEPDVNRVSDPWPSIVGTSVHAWLAGCFTAHNANGARWLPEQRVTPHPLHPGTADLYDGREWVVVDWKVLGNSSLEQVSSPAGPPVKYKIQLKLYGRGYRLLGLPVRKTVLVALPRTAPNLDGMYVWEQPCGEEDDALLEAVFALTHYRKALAEEVRANRLPISSISISPDSKECFFCPFFRPASRRDGAPGCPGTYS